MASHTPGPWRLGTSARTVVADTPVSEGTGHDDVAFYGGHLIAESIARREDAQLIASAPELLAALERVYGALGYERDGMYCYNCHTHRPEHGGTPHKADCLTRVMREAISKARGEAVS